MDVLLGEEKGQLLLGCKPEEKPKATINIVAAGAAWNINKSLKTRVSFSWVVTQRQQLTFAVARKGSFSWEAIQKKKQFSREAIQKEKTTINLCGGWCKPLQQKRKKNN